MLREVWINPVRYHSVLPPNRESENVRRYQVSLRTGSEQSSYVLKETLLSVLWKTTRCHPQKWRCVATAQQVHSWLYTWGCSCVSTHTYKNVHRWECEMARPLWKRAIVFSDIIPEKQKLGSHRNLYAKVHSCFIN